MKRGLLVFMISLSSLISSEAYAADLEVQAGAKVTLGSIRNGECGAPAPQIGNLGITATRGVRVSDGGVRDGRSNSCGGAVKKRVINAQTPKNAQVGDRFRVIVPNLGNFDLVVID